MKPTLFPEKSDLSIRDVAENFLTSAMSRLPRTQDWALLDLKISVNAAMAVSAAARLISASSGVIVTIRDTWKLPNMEPIIIKCPSCGGNMQPSGNCFRCTNCGETTGCG